MSESKKTDDDRGVNRRKVLECMTWAGTGVLWTISGGVPRSLGIIDQALAAEPSKLTFLQISDSHVGFDKPANPNAIGTLQEAIGKIKSLPARPSFMIHTGDITHLSKPAEFDNADRAISEAGLDVHYVPGEHDLIDEEVKFYRERYGKNAKGSGWYSFDADGVHFIGLGRSSSSGSRTMLPAAPQALRSWSSPTFRCGPCTSNGAGAPTMAPAPSRC